MKGPITGLRKWPELGSDWGRAVRPSCQIWPCPEKSTLVSRQKGRKLFFGKRWGAENLVEQEMVETPKGPGLVWSPLCRPLPSSLAARSPHPQQGTGEGRPCLLLCVGSCELWQRGPEKGRPHCHWRY